MNRYTFDDGMQITANNDKEADLIYNDIIINRHNGETRSFEELNKLAKDYYNKRNDSNFYYFSDDELALLWSKCMFTNSHPFGQAYDDEVFETISSLSNKDEIFAKAEEYADEEEKNFKGKPFFKSESLKENMTIEDMFKDVGVKIVFDDNGHFTKEAEEKYDEVAKKFFDGNQDKLDKLCDEEKCFDESLKESSDENWAVFAKDKSTGKEYCSGVYESKNYAYYWATMDKNADLEYGYGDFEYRVEKVPEYSDELLKSSTELNNLKLANYDKAKEKDDELLKEKVENSYSYKNYIIINDSKSNCWRIKDSKDNWIGNCFSTDKEAEEFIDNKDESLKENTLNNTDMYSDIQTWYKEAYPTDELASQMKSGFRFVDLYKELFDNNNFNYKWVADDSIIRERVFTKLAELKGLDYDDVYYKWLDSDDENESLKEEKGHQKHINEASKDDVYFKAFITNLGKYNEGELVGEWIEFPIDEDDFNEILKKIGISDESDADGNYYEEWFVTDYDCGLSAFDWQELGEYPNYDTLQEWGELIQKAKEVGVEAVDNAYEVTGDLKEAIDGLENGSIIYYSEIHSDSDLGQEIIDQIYGDGIPKDTLDSYFDYEALGRDLGFDEYENSEYDDFDMEEAVREYIDENGYDEIKSIDEFIDFKSMGEYLYDGDEDLTDEQYIEWAKNYVKENGYDDAEDYIDFDSLGEWLKDNSLIDVPEQYISAGEYWCGDEYASDSDIGYAYVEAVGPDGVANPENYFDYESFGRDLTFGNFTLTSDGAIEQI